jgi:hypothetical protein
MMMMMTAQLLSYFGQIEKSFLLKAAKPALVLNYRQKRF